MLIDLTDIINGSCDSLVLDESFKMPEINFLGEDFGFFEDFHLNGKIINNSKTLELSATVNGKTEVHCARCAKPITVDVEFPVNEVLIREGADGMEDEDVVYYSGKSVELGEVIENSFLLNVPGRYLCSEDCKGICPRCGKNLNEGSCDCVDDYIDPRLEKLAEIMKNMSDTE